MTNAVLVLAKLTTLREHVDRMERRRPSDAATLHRDIDRQDALSLSLLVALQEAYPGAFGLWHGARVHPIGGTRLSGIGQLEAAPCAPAERATRQGPTSGPWGDRGPC
jgi:hypothetical protein